MTISNSVKAQLFALYLNQKVFTWLDNIQDPTELNGGLLGMMTGDQFDDAMLQLRSVSDLTDVEQVVIIGIFKSSRVTQSGKSFADGIYHTLNFNQMGWEIATCIDYLRSIGIALPFTYLNENHPITLSVEELINLNWVKLSVS